MRLIVITPPLAVNEEARLVNSLFANGLQRLHVRKPSFTNDDHRKYLADIDSQWYTRIVLHDCYELYSECSLGGIHLNSFSRDDVNTWQQIKDIPPSAISTSFHAWEEIEQNTFPYGYVFISPVFDSISKTGYKAGIALSQAMETQEHLAIRDKYCPPIIGLGGVIAEKIELLYQNGFDGAAMLGAVWQSEDPVKVFKQATERINSLQGI